MFHHDRFKLYNHCLSFMLERETLLSFVFSDINVFDITSAKKIASEKI